MDQRTFDRLFDLQAAGYNLPYLQKTYQVGMQAKLRWADLRGADLSETNLRWADLSEANMSGADLSEAYLRGADLSEANMSGTNLRGAYLRWTDLSGANMSGADLSEADLRWTNLRGANLRGANLRGANLRWTNLSKAYLSEADLSGAKLSGADLDGADLSGANLSQTCLDPANEIDAEKARVALEAAGIHVNERGSFVAFRTATSKFVGDTQYVTGRTYHAPVFSVDTSAECHPGLYFGSEDWLRQKYPNDDLMRVVSNVRNVVAAGDKFRCKRFRVVSGG